jgi:hypothetical protein
MEALKTCNNTKNNRNSSADLETQLESSIGGNNSNNTSSSESLGQVILNLFYLELPVVGALLLVALWVGWMEGWSIVGSRNPSVGHDHEGMMKNMYGGGSA